VTINQIQIRQIDIVHMAVRDGQPDRMADSALRYIIGGRGEVEMYWPDDTWPSIIRRVIRRVGDGPKLDILQMHSHGHELTGAMFSGRLSSARIIESQSSFRALGGCFKPDGQIFLKGCKTARQYRMMQELARIVNVNVTAGYEDQYAGRSIDIFHGRTRTVFPNGNFENDRPGILRVP